MLLPMPAGTGAVTTRPTAHMRVVAILSFAMVVALVDAQAQTLPTADTSATELKLSVVVAPLYPLGAAARTWADALNDPSRSPLKVKFYPGAQLADHDATKEFRALQAGAIDMAVGST